MPRDSHVRSNHWESRELPSLTYGDRIAAVLEKHSLAVLACALIAVCFAAWAAGRLKPLWYDEIFSVIVAKTRSWGDMKVAMTVDANPPLLASLIRLCLHLFGDSDFSVRLPSLLGFLGALVGVFVFTRREAGNLLALLATCLVLSQPGLFYAYEARPYALLLGFMMLGLVSWQTASNAENNRALALFGIWSAFVLSMLTHNLGLVETGLPLVFGEVARSLKRRRIDWPIWAAGAASLPVLLFTYPLSKRTNDLLLSWNRAYVYPLNRERFFEFWVHQPLNSFHLLISPALLLFLVAIALLYMRKIGAWPSIKASPSLWAAAGACLLIPVTYLIMTSSSGYFNCRYGIGSIAGIALLFALIYSNCARVSKPLLVLLILASLGRCIVDATRDSLQPRVEPSYGATVTDPRGLPYVVANPFTMMPHWYYGSQPERRRLVYLRDRPDAIKDRYIIVDICIAAVADISKINAEDASAFVADHAEFLFEDDKTVPAKNMAAMLKADGYTFEVQPQYGQNVYLLSRNGD